MESIINYIKSQYSPLGIILYGSYANGTNGPNSDFDALVISRQRDPFHDTTVVDGVRLDVFVYPVSYFEAEYDRGAFVQIADGRIVMDTDHVAKDLQSKILAYLQNCPSKTDAEIQDGIDWCVKMLERAQRDDAEGRFRWHWVLVDSLEIFCDAMGYPYSGPKKSLQWMQENHPKAFSCYARALMDFSPESLSAWISYLTNIK